MLPYLLFAGAIAWILAGLAIVSYVDRREMQKPVPYGSVPAVFPLSTIRAIMPLFLIVLGPWYLAGAVAAAVMKFGRVILRARRLERLRRRRIERQL